MPHDELVRDLIIGEPLTWRFPKPGPHVSWATVYAASTGAIPWCGRMCVMVTTCRDYPVLVPADELSITVGYRVHSVADILQVVVRAQPDH